MRPRNTQFVAAAGVLFVGLSLRPGITAIAPVIVHIEGQLDLTSTDAGMLTRIPLVCFVAFSTLAAKIGYRIGFARSILGSLVILAVGFLIRDLAGVATLYFGTAIIGIATTFGNVLLPAYIKQRDRRSAGILTGIYTVSLYLGPALAASLTLPLSAALGSWRAAITVWGLLAVIAFVAWLPQARSARAPDMSTGPRGNSTKSLAPSLWRQPLAWSVTAYFAILSILFYTVSTWLPTMLTNLGLISSTASRMLSIVNFAAIPCALIVSLLVVRTRTQIWATTTESGLLLIGLFGILASPTHLTLLWVIIFGLGHGTSTGVAYSLPLLRTRTARATAELGGMSQTAGYSLAAVGPVGAGYLHDLTNGWTALLLVLIVLVIVQLICGLLAGSNGYVADVPPPTPQAIVGRSRPPDIAISG